jgi:hypothetical protein
MPEGEVRHGICGAAPNNFDGLRLAQDAATEEIQETVFT